MSGTIVMPLGRTVPDIFSCLEEQMVVLSQDVERTRELLTREQDDRQKVVLSNRFQLREGRVLPLSLTFLVPTTAEEIS